LNEILREHLACWIAGTLTDGIEFFGYRLKVKVTQVFVCYLCTCGTAQTTCPAFM